MNRGRLTVEEAAEAVVAARRALTAATQRANTAAQVFRERRTRRPRSTLAPGFLQHHWQDRYHPMKLTVYVALLWALWHVPDHFAEEGWGVEQLIAAPVVFAIGFVSLFFARALLV
jgi:hypothetical protein